MHIHFMYYSSFFFANFSQKQDKHLNIYELSIIKKKKKKVLKGESFSVE